MSGEGLAARLSLPHIATMNNNSALATRLRREPRSQVLFSAASRGRYATDASIYQMTPIGVVVPQTMADVAATLAIAREEGVPVLPRGAWARARMLAMAPSLIDRPNTSAISRARRSKLTACVMCRWRISAQIPGPNGEPGSNPTGAGALTALRQ